MVVYGRFSSTVVLASATPGLQLPQRAMILVLLLSQFRRKEGNVLFNDALNTFYLRLYGVRHMVKDHSDSERGNQLPISNKGSFICIIPQTG